MSQWDSSYYRVFNSIRLTIYWVISQNPYWFDMAVSSPANAHAAFSTSQCDTRMFKAVSQIQSLSLVSSDTLGQLFTHFITG